MKWNTNQIQIMSDDEIIALSQALKDELDLRKREKIDAAFNNMISAINAYKKVNPYAEFHYETYEQDYSIPIANIASAEDWY